MSYLNQLLLLKLQEKQSNNIYLIDSINKNKYLSEITNQQKS